MERKRQACAAHFHATWLSRGCVRARPCYFPLLLHSSAGTRRVIRLQEITLREIQLPLKEPFRISSGVVLNRRILLLQLKDTDGVVEWSECVAGEQPNYSPETIDTAWLALREWLAPRVLGREFEHPSALRTVLDQDVRGHQMAKAAIEMGAWALLAVKREMSLARLLGGTRERVEVGISLG